MKRHSFFRAYLVLGGLFQWGLGYGFVHFNHDIQERMVAHNTILGAPPWLPNKSYVLFDLRMVLVIGIAWVVTYVFLLKRVPADNKIKAADLVLAIFFPTALQLVAITVLPYQSIDLFSYLGHGYIGSQPLGNPYLQLDKSLANTPVGAQLSQLGWMPQHGVSPYGPLWTHVETLTARVMMNAREGARVLKTFFVILNFFSAWLVWRIVSHFKRRDTIKGMLLFLWNPLIISQLGLEGHNDSTLVCFALFSLYTALQGKIFVSAIGQTLGILSKYITILLVPAELIFFWKQRVSNRDYLTSVGRATAVGCGLMILCFAKFWIGLATFTGGADNFQDGWGSAWGGIAIRGIGLFFFALYFTVWTLRVKDKTTLTDAFAVISLAYVLFGSPVVWPWYYALPLALMGIASTRVSPAMYWGVTTVGMITGPLCLVYMTGLFPNNEVYPLGMDQGQWNWALAALFLLLTLRPTLHDLKNMAAVSNLTETPTD